MPSWEASSTSCTGGGGGGGARAPGPDEYRRLSANWKDRSKADEFVAIAVEQYESDNRSPSSSIDFENGQEADADAWLDF